MTTDNQQQQQGQQQQQRRQTPSIVRILQDAPPDPFEQFDFQQFAPEAEFGLAGPDLQFAQRGDESEEAFNVRLTQELERRGLPAVTGLPAGSSLADINTALRQQLETRGAPGTQQQQQQRRQQAGQAPLNIAQMSQEAAEFTSGAVLGGVQGIVPGEQQFEQQRREQLEAGADPFTANIRGFQGTDLPSTPIDVTPGFDIPLPGKRRLDEVDVGVKGAMEIAFDPLNLLGLGGAQQVRRGVLGEAAREGITEPLQAGAQAVGRATRQQLTLNDVVELAARGGGGSGIPPSLRAANAANTATRQLTLPPGTKFQLPDTLDPDIAYNNAFHPNVARRVGNRVGALPVVGDTLRLADPSIGTTSFEKRMAITRASIRDDVGNKTQEVMAHANQSGNQRDLFGPTDLNTGLLTTGKFKGYTLNELQERISEFRPQMTASQAQFLDRLNEIETAILDYARANNIDIGEIVGKGNERFAGRFVMGKLDDLGEIESFNTAKIPSGFGRRTSSEMRRTFEGTINEGVSAGYVYMPYEDAVRNKLRGMYNRVIDKRMSEHIMNNLPDGVELRKPLSEIPEIAAVDRRILGQNNMRAALDRATKAANDAIQGRRIHGNTINAIRNHAPDIADRLDEALSVPVPTVEQVIRGLPTDMRRMTGVNAQNFRDALDNLGIRPASGTGSRRPLKFTEIRRVLQSLSRDAREGERFLRSFYNEVYKTQKDVRNDRLRGVIEDANALKPDVRRRLDSLRSERTRAKELADQRAIQSPKFPGIKFADTPQTKEFVRNINNALTDPTVNKWVDRFSQASGPARVMGFAGDASPFLIQLAMYATDHPKGFFKSGTAFAEAFTRALISPASARRMRARMLASEPDMLARWNGIIWSGNNEMTEALGARGLMAPINPLDPGLTKGSRIRGSLGTLAAPLRPFQQGYEAAMDAAGWHYIKAFDAIAKTPQERAIYTDHINNMRGLSSSARLNVNPNQRGLESGSLISPRYARAFAALTFSALQGGLRGRLARRAFMHFAAGSAAAYAGTTILWDLQQGKSPRQIEQDLKNGLNPSSPQFLSWNVGNTTMGLGGKFRSSLSLFTKIGLTGASLVSPYEAEPWQDVTEFEEFRDNPVVRWVRGQLSPFVSSSIDIMEGRNYVGDPTGTIGFLDSNDPPSAWQKALVEYGEDIIPLWVAGSILDGGDELTPRDRVTLAATGFVGLRSNPQSASVQLRLARIRAMEARDIDTTTTDFYDLDVRVQEEIEQDPDVRAAKEFRQEQLLERGERAAEFQRDMSQLDQSMNDALVQKFMELGGEIVTDPATGETSMNMWELRGAKGAEFRNFMREKRRERALNMQNLQEQYSDVLESWDEIDPPSNRFNIALQKYRNLIYDEALTDPVTGDYDFEEREARIEGLKMHSEVGEDLLEQVQEYERSQQHPIIQQYTRDLEVLDPYLGLVFDAMERAGLEEQYERYRQLPDGERELLVRSGDPTTLRIKAIERLGDRIKEEMRKTNKELDRLLYLWGYTRQPMHPDNVEMDVLDGFRNITEQRRDREEAATAS